MRLKSLLLAALLVAGGRPAPAHADAALHFPLRFGVRTSTSLASTGAPAYAGDVFEIRLSRAAAGRLAAPTRAGRVRALGLAGVDAAVSAIGATLEPEFVGETPPPFGSRTPDFTAFYVVHLPAGSRLEDAMTRFARVAEVVSVSPIGILRTTATPNDSLFASSTWYDQASDHDIDAPEAWGVTTGDSRITVAVLDCGVSLSHPDLVGTTAGAYGNLRVNLAEKNGTPGVDDDGNGFVDDVYGWDFVNIDTTDAQFKPATGEDAVNEDNDPNDMVGHGTGCAGLIGALTDNLHGVAGTAWQVKILPVRIGWLPYGYAAGSAVGDVRMDFVAKGVRYATRMGANVINMSFSNLDTDGLGAAVTAAIDAGITVVVSAGNSFSPNDLGQLRDDVISVAGVDPNDVMWPTSSYGPWVDIAAPGSGIASTWTREVSADSLGRRDPWYKTGLNGTSFAAPIVSGTVALMQAHQLALGRPLLSPAAVRLRLWESADDIRAQNPGMDGQLGGGRLNAYRAVATASGSSATPGGGKSVGPAAVITFTSGSTRVAYATENAKLVILDGVTRDTVVVRSLPAVPSTGVAVADMGGGRGVRMFIGTETGQVLGYDAFGTPLANWPVQAGNGITGGPALGDIDGDGVLDVVAGSADGTLMAWSADGADISGFPRSYGGRVLAPAISPIDTVSGVEIVVVTDDLKLRVIKGNGTPQPGWATPKTLAGTPHAPVVLRRGPGQPPLVMVAADNQLYAWNSDGSPLAGYPITLGGPAISDPAIGDLDNDNNLDFVIATDSPPVLDARSLNGASLPGWPRPLAVGTVGNPVIGQLAANGGHLELMVLGGNGLQAWTRDGDSLAAFPKPGGAGHDPTIASIDGDDDSDVIAGTGPDSVFYIYSAGPGSREFGPAGWPTMRGNMARTGSALYSAHPAVIDDRGPSAITDLTIFDVTGTSVRLAWTAPGDDSTAGTADHYDVRYSNTPITEANFSSAGVVFGIPNPHAGGTPESLLVNGLTEGVNYYFAIKTTDDAGHVSPISNVPNAVTPSSAPSPITDLTVVSVSDSSVTLSWTAVGDDAMTGRPQYYAIHGSEQPMTANNFDGAPFQLIKLSTVDAGGTETAELKGLPQSTLVYLAVRAYDASGNPSPMSNQPTAETKGGGPLAGHVGIGLAFGSTPSRLPITIYYQADPASIGQPVRMFVYDTTGRLRRTFNLGTGPGGSVTWNGHDDFGDRMGAGIYFGRLSSGGKTAKARLVLVP